MSKICQVTGRKPKAGMNVSHSHRRTKRRFLPNLMKKRVVNPETGRMERMTISAKGLKILQKKFMK